MITGAPKNENNERGYINHHGDMTEDQLIEAAKRRREKKRGLKD